MLLSFININAPSTRNGAFNLSIDFFDNLKEHLIFWKTLVICQHDDGKIILHEARYT